MNQSKHSLYSSRTADKFVVRLPDGVRSQVEAYAREQHRSMNSYIILAVENQLRAEGGPHVEAPVVQQQWIPAIGEMVWLNKGPYLKKPVLVTVSEKYAIYQADFVPGLSGDDKPNIVMDVYFNRFHGHELVKVTIDGVALAYATSAEL